MCSAGGGEQSLAGLLTARGLLTSAQVREVGEKARAWRSGFTETLLALGLVDPGELARAIADSAGLPLLDPRADPLDPAFAEPGDLAFFVRHRLLPWRRSGGRALIAVVNPFTARKALDEELSGEPYAMRVITQRTLTEALISAQRDRQVRAAVDRLGQRLPEFSARSGLTIAQLFAFALLAGAVGWGFHDAPAASLSIVAVLAGVFYIATMAFRLFLMLAGLWPRGRRRGAATAAAGDLPHYSVLVALHNEADIVRHTAEAIGRLDYPWTRLDVLFLLEEADTRTRAACEALGLDGRFTLLVVPNKKPRTKPKACNFGLAFARGDYVVLYDAEDRPEPDQLLLALEEFARRPRNVACLQARLNFYNARENWLTSQFALEFAIWFQFILPGLERLGLPIPLGGTSNHFRVEALRAAGGWDAHNVTEDADLGIRFARLGYRVRTLSSMTAEEANCALPNWIHQRSRWLKGYLQTYLVHMRRPGRLWRELAPAGFISFQLLLGGAVLSPLLHLAFWGSLVAHYLGAPILLGLDWSQLWTPWNLLVLLAGNGTAILCGLIAALQSDFRGLDRPALALNAFAMPIYWFLIAFAVVKGIFSYFGRPFYWAKTKHGISRVSPRDVEGRRYADRRVKARERSGQA